MAMQRAVAFETGTSTRRDVKFQLKRDKEVPLTTIEWVEGVSMAGRQSFAMN